MKTCVLIGHREIEESDGLKETLKKQLDELIHQGVGVFLNGGMGQFDRLCARAVYELKQEQPFIQQYLVIPYLTFHTSSPYLFDEIIYPPLENVYFKRAIVERNRYMVDHATYALCYIRHTWGGAYQTYSYAKKKGLLLIEV